MSKRLRFCFHLQWTTWIDDVKQLGRGSKRMRRMLVILVTLFMTQTLSRSLAWFDMGHMTVAAVAYSKLDAPVRAKIERLLQLNPDYETWVVGVPAEHHGMVAFVRAATWADDIKKRHYYINHPSASQDGAHASDNIGYEDLLVHPYWHFVDLP